MGGAEPKRGTPRQNGELSGTRPKSCSMWIGHSALLGALSNHLDNLAIFVIPYLKIKGFRLRYCVDNSFVSVHNPSFFRFYPQRRPYPHVHSPYDCYYLFLKVT